jgi:hypothetical protein
MTSKAGSTSVLAIVLLTGCLAADDEFTDEEVAASEEALLSSNALTKNALAFNALTRNSLTRNALTSNALTSNALTSNSLTRNALTSTELHWSGRTDGDLSREMLSYVYSCAMPQGTTMSMSIGGSTYTFQGMHSLAPQWGTGACNLSCQRWVSACVLARVNYYGVSVSISMRGTALGVASSSEQSQYSRVEGAFWGNLFQEYNSRGQSCIGKNWDVAYYQRQRQCARDPQSCGFPASSWWGDCREQSGAYSAYPWTPACNGITSDGAYFDCASGVAGERYNEVLTIYLQ